MHVKDFTLKVKAAGPDDGLEEGQFLAYASVFGNVDSYGDVVVKGAFADSLNEWAASDQSIPTLWGHDMYDPYSNIGGVVEAKEDDHGLLVKSQLDMENPKAAQVYRLIKGRRINQMSFAYDVLDGGQSTVDGESVNELRKLKLYEVSVVPLGANQETEILAVKANADALADGLKAGRAISAKNESELRKAHDAIGRVLSALDDADQEKASGTPAVNDEEPEAAKSEEPPANPSARTLIAELAILSLS